MASVLDRIFTLIKARLVKAQTDTRPEGVEHPAVEHLAPKIVPLDEQPISREDALGGRPMAAEENRAIVRRYIEEVWNMGELATLDEVVAADQVSHNAPPGQAPGIEGLRQFVTTYRAAFPDTHLTIEDLITEGDKVVTRWTGRGTHRGDLMGIPPTGKQATVTGISIDRIADGKIVEDWTNWDELGLMQQLGVSTAPAQAPAGQ